MTLILSTKSRCRAGYKTHKKVGNIRHCYPKPTVRHNPYDRPLAPKKRTANRGMKGADSALKAKLAAARAQHVPKHAPAKRTANRGMVGADAALKAKLAKARADFIKKDASPQITPLPKKPIRPVGIQIDEI